MFETKSTLSLCLLHFEENKTVRTQRKLMSVYVLGPKIRNSIKRYLLIPKNWSTQSLMYRKQ
jgi:hypothetical protein